MLTNEILIWVSTSGRHNSVFLQAGLMQRALKASGQPAALCYPGSDSAWENLRKIFSSKTVVWHFSSFDSWLLLFMFKRDMVLLYHNITPPRFFLRTEPMVAIRAWFGRFQLIMCSKRWNYAAVSEFNRSELIKMGKSPVALLPCQVTVGKATNVKKSPQPSIFFAGRIVENKNCIVLVQQMEKVAIELDGPLRLIILGTGNQKRQYFKYFCDTVERLRSRGRLQIEWINGEIDDESLAGLYAESWLYVSMSLHEGFGLPVCEAIVRGTPAVYLSCGGTESVLGGAGSMPASNADEFFHAVIDHLRSEGDRQSLLVAQQEALASYLPPHSEEKVVRGILQLFGGRS